MAAAHSFLSLERFESLYRDQKPYFEYWFGEAIQKEMPTTMHGVTQVALSVLLVQRGWKPATEVRLKISALANPVPDLIADAKRLQIPYPTEPFDLCVEILSPGDDLRKLFQKAAHYLDWEIGTVWIIDPTQRRAYSMSREAPVPVEVNAGGELTAGSANTLSLPLNELFAEADKMLGN
jgi:Uma2 family endonuclease